MLQNIKDLYGKKLAATDGDIGHVKDFFFDDKTWTIRYMVVETGSWLTGRLVLLSPNAFGKLDPYEKTIHVNLLKQQIQDSPPIGSHTPVSRKYEADYFNYYGWPAYWESGATSAFPVIIPPVKDEFAAGPKDHPSVEKHLQSTRDITGYHIQTSDGAIGHVSSFLVDERSCVIRELVVESGHWSSHKEVLISVNDVEKVSYEDSKVFVNLAKTDVQTTPEHSTAKHH